MNRRLPSVACLFALPLFLCPFNLRAEDSIISGSLSNRYVFRTTGGEDDHDLKPLLTLDLGRSPTDRVTAALQAGGNIDLDGSEGTSTFSGISSTFHSRTLDRLYYAYVNARDVGPIANLRAGRHYRHAFEQLHFDGLTLESEPFWNFTASTFGGVPVHLYENQFGLDRGDWLAGGALEWNPVSNFQVRSDYVHLRDATSGFRIPAGDQEDDLFAGTMWWDPMKNLGFTTRFTSFSDQVRDVAFAATLRVPEETFLFRLDVFRLLEGYGIRVVDFDVAGIAGTYQPYTEISLTASKGLGNHIDVDGVLSARLLDRNQIASAFNHGFKRAMLSLTLSDLPWEGLSLTGSGDYYHGEDSALRNDYVGASFTASQLLLEKRLKLSAGTMYSLYRFNLWTGNESTDVQTFFAKIGWKIIKALEAQAGYEFEENHINNFYIADMRLVWHF